MLGSYSKALELLSSRHFHPWEGGEGKVTGQYVYAHTELGKQALRNGDYSKAIVHFKEAQYYPDNLGEGKLTGALENDILYYQGCAYSALGNTAKAEECWTLAAKGQKEPSNAFFYNDQQPDKIFYQGLSLRKLGNESEAIQRFKALSNYGELHFDDQVKIDYFAVSLPDLLIWEEDLNRRNAINCSYLMALGFLGQGKTEKAIEHLRWVLSKDVNHQGAVRELTNLN
jgi:tetratricopeptide (TPR) repeat protein